MKRDLVVLACAISAGIHAALTPEHFREGVGAGGGFVVATILLAALAVVLTRWPSDLAFAATAVVLTGLIAAYALVLTTGVPVLHPEVEPVDGLALATKAIEVVGALAAVYLLRPSVAIPHRTKGTLA
jgi:hypothetical protein